MSTSRTIFIIDDSEIDTYILKRFLRMTATFNDYIIQEFSFAQEALNFLNTGMSEDTFALPEFIFLDINMPDMDGFEFLEKYHLFTKKFSKQSHIIFISSSDNVDDFKKAQLYKNVIGYLKKPTSEARIREIVEGVALKGN